MRVMRRRWLAVVVFGVGVAVADTKPPRLDSELGKQLASYHAAGAGDPPPSFAFTGHDHVIDEWGGRYSGGSFGEIYEPLGAPTVGVSKDGTVAWVAVNSRELVSCIDASSWSGNGDAFPCPEDKRKIITRESTTYAPGDVRHATGLFVKTAKGWAARAYHIGVPASEKEIAGSKAKLPPIKRHLGGADEIVKVFEASIGSSKTLAKTLSERTDVVMYGSELAEHYVTTAKVREVLDKWNLKITVDGLHAGVASKTVGFVAANVRVTVGKGKPTPYRLLAIYEKTDAWKVVQLHFSFPLVTD